MSKLGRDFLRRGQLCRAWWVYDVDALLGSASWKGLVGKEIVLEGCGLGPRFCARMAWQGGYRGAGSYGWCVGWFGWFRQVVEGGVARTMMVLRHGRGAA